MATDVYKLKQTSFSASSHTQSLCKASNLWRSVKNKQVLHSVEMMYLADEEHCFMQTKNVSTVHKGYIQYP